MSEVSTMAQVASHLRRALAEGKYRPGQKLPEANLCHDLGVSRNTLREAFRLLESEALLLHQPNRGVFVRRPDLASILDIYAVRRLLEPHILRQSTPLHAGADRLFETADALQNAAVAEDWSRVGRLNIAFHMAVIALADSPRLDSMFERIFAEMQLCFLDLPEGTDLHKPYVPMKAEIIEYFRRFCCNG